MESPPENNAQSSDSGEEMAKYFPDEEPDSIRRGISQEKREVLPPNEEDDSLLDVSNESLLSRLREAAQQAVLGPSTHNRQALPARPGSANPVLAAPPGFDENDVIERSHRKRSGSISGMNFDASPPRFAQKQDDSPGSNNDHQREDEEQTNSTISTMEAGGLANEDWGSNEELSSLNPQTVDWLNNQVAVAISNGVLPVTCKQLRGELHLNKFGSGNRGKCILAYNQWFTPTEFEAFAGRGQCKDWKRSIKFHSRSLLQLTELDILKVHAVSCTCTACWNGESQGPVRLHDVKRKTSSFTVKRQHSSQQTASTSSGRSAVAANPKLVAHSSSVDDGGAAYQGAVDEPLLKQIRLELQGQPSQVQRQTLPAESLENGGQKISLGNATLVRNADGTLRIVNASLTPATQTSSGGATASTTAARQVQVTGPGGQQTLAFLIPGNPTKPMQSPALVRQKSQAPSATAQALPVGMHYAPVQMSAPPPRSSGGVTVVSTELNEHWSTLEEFIGNLHQQLQTLIRLVASTREKSDKALQDLYAQMQSEKEKELIKMRTQMRQAHAQEDAERGSTTKLCANCNRTATMACAACQTTFYCGEFCVRKDSAIHKTKCQPKPVGVELVNID